MTAIDEVPLVGGRLCLDFVNTTGARESESPRERLLAFSDLLVWARRADLLSEEEQTRLTSMAEGRSAAAEAALERARQIRETLYDVLRPLAEGERPRDAALSALDAVLTEFAKRRRLDVRADGLAWRWSREPAVLAWLLGPVLHSAERLLIFETTDSLKRCGECDWLFVDETRNRSRRWCKKLCGDRVRARRYYRRRKQE